MKYIEAIVMAVSYWDEVQKATKYVSEKEVITATRIGKKRKGSRSIDIHLKIGKPNFLERKFIKDCKKAGVSFPVKKIQLKHYPKKKKK